MREEDAVVDGRACGPRRAPRRADEVAEAVDRADRRLVERRRRRTRSPDAPGDARPSACAAATRASSSPSASAIVAGSADAAHVARPRGDAAAGRWRSSEQRLAPQVRSRIAGDRERVHVARLDARHRRQARIAARGKPGPVLDAAEALLLDGRDELAVAHERGRRRRRDTR